MKNKMIKIKMLVLLLCAIVYSAGGQTSTKNYVKTTLVNTPVTTESAVNGLSIGDKNETVEYYDGLGRSIQMVNVGASPGNKDIVDFTEYDKYAKTPRNYLPFAASGSGGNYVSNPEIPQGYFYQSADKVAHTLYPYSEQKFEGLNTDMLVEEAAPGESWEMGSGHTRQYDLLVNTVADKVLKWQMDENTCLPYVETCLSPDPLDLIAYADFETETNNTAWTYDDASMTTDEQYEGAKSLHLNNSGTTNEIKKTGLSPTEVYVLTFWAKGAGGIINIHDETNGNTLLEEVILTNEWVYHEFLFSSIQSVKLSGSASSNRYVDNVSLYNPNSTTLISCEDFEWVNPGGGDGGHPCDGIELCFWDWLTGPPHQVSTSNGIYPYSGDYFYDLSFGGSLEYTNLDPNKQYQVSVWTNSYEEGNTGNPGLIEVNGSLYGCGLEQWVELIIPITGASNLTITTGSADHQVYIDKVCIYEVSVDHLYVPKTYGPGELFVQESTDEHDLKTFVYADKNERVLLVRKETGNPSPAMLYKYLVYDNRGNSAAIIPPKAMAQLMASGNYDVTTLNGDLLYLNKYDGKNRLIVQDNADEDPIYFVYDVLDRIIMMQDGHLAATDQWKFTKYDCHGRVILQGITTDTRNRDDLQSTIEYLQNIQSITTYEKRSSANFSNLHGYTSTSWPSGGYATGEVLEVYYFDDYDFDYNGIPDYNFIADPQFEYTALPETRVKGLVTGQKLAVLGLSSGIMTTEIRYYDEYERIMHSQFYNPQYFLGVDLTYAQFNFDGTLAQAKTIHQSGQPGEVTKRARYFYDHMNRLTREYMKIDNDPEVMTKDLEYNEIGQLVEMNVHSLNNGIDFLQSTDFRYNIRGWLTHINNCELEDDYKGGSHGDPGEGGAEKGGKGGGFAPFYSNDDNDDLFGMTIHYDYLIPGQSGVSNYNGNVSAICWQSASDNVKRSYGYLYDGINRLTKGNYSEYDDLAQQWTQNIDRYGIGNINYDENSNMLSADRYGFGNNSGFGQIDALDFDFEGNRLLTADEASGNSGDLDFDDGGTSLATEYIYDGNGNLIQDLNMGLTITYNHLNLPETVSFPTNGRFIRYRYDAKGKILGREVYENGSPPQYTNYQNGFVYNGGSLEYIGTPDGRIVPDNSNGNNYRYEYYLKDHLGSIRLCYSDLNADGSIDASNEVIQENHYYPFGMEMQGLATPQIGPENMHKYQAKEYQHSFGFGWYNFHSRYYNASLNRWSSTDPVVAFSSPYNPMANNPASFADPDGQLPVAAIIIGAAVVFGAINVGLNARSISNSRQPALAAVGYFFIGAAIGAATAAITIANPPLGFSIAAGGILNTAKNEAYFDRPWDMPLAFIAGGLVGATSTIPGLNAVGVAFLTGGVSGAVNMHLYLDDPNNYFGVQNAPNKGGAIFEAFAYGAISNAVSFGVSRAISDVAPYVYKGKQGGLSLANRLPVKTLVGGAAGFAAGRFVTGRIFNDPNNRLSNIPYDYQIEMQYQGLISGITNGFVRAAFDPANSFFLPFVIFGF